MGVIPRVLTTLIFRHSVFTDIEFIKQAGLTPQILWNLCLPSPGLINTGFNTGSVESASDPYDFKASTLSTEIPQVSLLF